MVQINSLGINWLMIGQRERINLVLQNAISFVFGMLRFREQLTARLVLHVERFEMLEGHIVLHHLVDQIDVRQNRIRVAASKLQAAQIGPPVEQLLERGVGNIFRICFNRDRTAGIRV
ncbi:hypothetical protein D3C84_960790 [compost metagenome]